MPCARRCGDGLRPPSDLLSETWSDQTRSCLATGEQLLSRLIAAVIDVQEW